MDGQTEVGDDVVIDPAGDELLDIPEANTPSSTSKKRHYFSAVEDVNILKEVLSILPFGKDVKKWTEICKNLDLDVKSIAIQRRFKIMFDKFVEDSSKSEKSSGTVEKYGEKERLLYDIQTLKKEKEKNPLANKSEDKRKSEAATMIRESAAKTLVKSKKPEEKTKRSIMDQLADNQKAELELKRQKLDLKKQELDQQAEERKKQNELEERKMTLLEKNQEFQNQILMQLVNSLKK